jgi:hypothetical protein
MTEEILSGEYAGKDCKRKARKEHLHTTTKEKGCRFDCRVILIGVIPSAAVLQAERGISGTP